MTKGPLRRLFWRVADALDYLWTLATLRARDRERIERAFPEIYREEPKGGRLDRR
jgi:hypothetical protein